MNSTNVSDYCNPGLRSTYIWTMDSNCSLINVDSYSRVEGCGDEVKGLFFFFFHKLLFFVCAHSFVYVCIDLVWLLGPFFKIILPVLLAVIIASVPVIIYLVMKIKIIRLKPPAAPAAGTVKTDELSGASNIDIVTKVLKSQHNIMLISDEELTNMRLIGRGSFAIVFRAKWHGTDVAVKRLDNLAEILRNDPQLFEKEIKLWSQLKHPCIVEFFGITYKLSLVMEFMEHGSLRNLLKKRPLASSTRIKLATQVAIAMDFLHSKGVIHRDLNPNNVMVTGPYGQLDAKLADFGLSTAKENPLQTTTVGTPIYAAPEVLRSSIFNEKTDVYSLALTLWFIETIKDPFSDCRTAQDLVAAVISRQERPSLVGCVLFPDIIQRCWAEDPDERPSGPEIVSALQALLVPHTTPNAAATTQ